MTVAGHHFPEGTRLRASFADDVPASNASVFSQDVKFAFGVIKARRRLVIGILLTTLLLALAYVWTTPRIYTSTAEVMIDPRKREIVNKEILPSGMGSSSLGADTFLLDSQVEVMLSDGALRQLIAAERLDEDDEIAGLGGSATVDRIKKIVSFVIGGPKAAALPPTPPVDRALKTLRSSLHVTREGNTYVLRVAMRSKDPVKSARIANAVVDIYVKQNVENAHERIKEVEAVLSSRLEELRSNAAEAQRAAEEFRSANGLLETDKSTIVEQQLRDLNQQYSLAAANTSKAEARWEKVRALTAAPLETALAAGAVQSNLLATLQDRYAAATAQEASLQTSLKARHPNLVAARSAREVLKKEIKLELARLVSRAKLDYEVAVANEAEIRERLSEAKKLTAETNEAAVTLKGLEQRAEAARTIYTEFLNRSQDAREQMTLPVDSVRIVSRAEPSSRPTWPVEPLILGFALVLGLIAGLVTAIMLYIIKGPPAKKDDGAAAAATA